MARLDLAPAARNYLESPRIDARLSRSARGALGPNDSILYPVQAAARRALHRAAT